eukprot:TRINITY_DN61972_c0_g3_i2.p1 TRINITY_DN61972_c0_g3~~TRINITY_DN61972_c0_g3_i2.p1  ORF type:complete len:123 (-),score=11.95 TRINITY_DN61972_c0_g3_i2:82-450(-)
MDVCIGELKGMISRREQMIQNFSYDEVRELQRVVVSSLLQEMELKLKMFKQRSQQIAQLPNFNKLLKKNDIEFEQHTAGAFKRTLTMFGENNEQGREKFREELEEVHQMFFNIPIHFDTFFF